MEIVDTHAHLYAEDEARYPMKENPLKPPAGTGTIAHLRQVTRLAGVAKVVAVQTGTAYLYDNSFMADTVKANSDWMKGVCLLNPHDPRSPMKLTRLVEVYGVRGLRVSFTGEHHYDGLLRLWEAAHRLGIVICALLKEDDFRILTRYIKRFTEVPVIIDHCAYLSASEAPGFPTLKALLKLKRFTNVYLKLSFLVMGSMEPYPCRDTHGLAKRVIEEFGAERCMWGSDFPTELWIPKVTYQQHLRIFMEEIGLSEDVKKAILETTPMKLWFPS